VAGGIPLIRPLRESLAGERIRRIMGIVNGTTNFVLTRMTEGGASYHDALAEAQRLGYAERDPTADVEGYDAAAKAAILASVAFGVRVVAGDVYREGISAVTVDDIAFAGRLGYVIKLLAVIEKAGGDMIAVRVHPAMVPTTHPLAAVRDSFNAVFVEGDAVGELMFLGRGAGGMPTASAVLGDLLDASHNLSSGGAGRTMTLRPASIFPIDELRSEYYLSVDVADRPGVLHAVAGVLGSHNVSIRLMEQVGLGAEARLVIIVHPALERDVQACLRDLRQLDVVDRTGGLLRVVDSTL
jgi:homoserine dehydrogenase